MNLRECLSQLTDDHLMRIIRCLGEEPAPGARAHLVKSLPERLRDRSYLSRVIGSLGGEELIALKMIAFAGGGKGVVVEKCHQRLNELSRKWRRNGAKVLEPLTKSGIIYTGRENYRQVYFIPDDLREDVAAILTPPMEESLLTPEGDPQPVRPEGCMDAMAPTRHVHLLLSYIAKNQVKCSQGGGLYRRVQRDLISALGLPDDLPDESEAFQAVQPLHLSFILSYCRKRGLLKETECRTLEVTSKADEWASAPAWTKAFDVFAFLYEEFIQSDADILTMLEIMGRMPEPRWIVLDRLAADLDALSLGHSWYGLSSRLEKAVKMLSYAGVISLGVAGERRVVRMSGIGRQLVAAVENRTTVNLDPLCELEKWFFVQGTFEVLVPATVDPSILWHLEHMADLAKPDQMLIYRITRQSVYRALVRGMGARDIMDFLETYSRNPLPQNVRYSVEEWCRGYGRLEFIDAVVLRCETEDLANQVKALKRLQPIILGAIGPCHLLIDRSRHEEAIQVLEEEGYMPKPTKQHQSSAV